LKLKIWNFYVKGLEFEILKIEMSKFGCVNIESWKIKTKIWNLFVKCMEGIWNFENWNVSMLKIENWNVWILKIENWNV